MRSILLLFFFSALVFANTIIVDKSGNGDYKTIQAAVDACQDGDTLLIRPGDYHPFSLFDKNCYIIGEDRELVKIDTSARATAVVINSIKEVTIENIWFTGNLTIALVVLSYDDYFFHRTIPKFKVNNCKFDFSPREEIKEDAIFIRISYAEMVNDKEDNIDSLKKNLIITNNTFINMKSAIAFLLGGILGKQDFSSLGHTEYLFEIDGRNNYYGVTDFGSIDSLIEDYRDPVDDRFINGVNYVFFNYDPWELEVLNNPNYTNGIRGNNFINNESVFSSGLIYDSNFVNIIEDDIIEGSKINIYPNPFNNQVTIEFQTPMLIKPVIKIYNSLGRETSTKVSIFYFDRFLKLDFSRLSSGKYFIVIPGKTQNTVRRVIHLK